jgi:hypothetical protein
VYHDTVEPLTETSKGRMSAIGFNRVILPAIRPRETSAICICADHQRGPSRPMVRFLLSKRKLRLSVASAPQQLVFRFGRQP